MIRRYYKAVKKHTGPDGGHNEVTTIAFYFLNQLSRVNSPWIDGATTAKKKVADINRALKKSGVHTQP